MEKGEQLVNLLLRETYANKISWSYDDVPRNLQIGSNDIYRSFLTTRLNENRFGLYEKSSKYYHDEFEYSWILTLGICILDFDKVIWEYDSNSPAINRLYDSARDQSSGIDDILKSLR